MIATLATLQAITLAALSAAIGAFVLFFRLRRKSARSKDAHSRITSEQIIREVPRAVIVCDVEGQVVSWNPEAELLYGWSEAEALGRSLWDLIRPDNVEQFKTELFEKMSAGESYQSEATLTDRRGRQFSAEILRTPLFDEGGKLIGSVGISRDISERERRRKELQESQERYATLAKAAFEAIVVLDEGRVVEANEQAEGMFGYTVDEARGKHFAEFIAPQDRERALANFAQGCPNIECYQALCWDGSVRDVEVNLRYLPYGGKMLAMVALRDVTHRREAQQMLQASEQRLRTVVEHMPVMMVAFDEHREIVAWNRECERVLGYRADEVVHNPKAIAMVYPDPVYREQVLREWQERGDYYFSWEWRLRCKDGSERVISWSNVSRDVPVPGWATWGIGIDVTEWRQSEQTLRLSSEQNRLLIDMAGSLIVGLDREYRVVEWNNEAERVFGLARADVMGKDFVSTIVPEAHRAEARSAFERLKPGEVLGAVEHRAWGADGSLRWLSWQLSRLEGVAAGSTEIIAVGRDITERRRQIEAVRESEQRFRTMADSAPVLIWVTDNAGQAVFFNQPWLAFRGRTIEQELGYLWRDGIHQEDVGHVRAQLDLDKNQRTGFEVECRLRRYDGEYRRVLMRAAPRVDSSGMYVGYVATGVDITDIRRTTEELAQSEQRYRAIVEEQTDFVCRYRPDGTITYANGALCRVRGESREELIGKSIVAATGDLRAENPESWNQFPTRPEECQPVTLEVPRGSDGPLWHQWVIQPIRDDAGQVVEYQAVGRDITEQERTRRQLAQSESKYRRLVELSPSGILLGYDGKIMFANSALAKMAGVDDLSRIIGTAYLDWIHPDQHPMILESMARARAGEQTLPRMELRLIRLDGVVIDVEVWAVPNYLEGKLVSQVILTDISDRKRSERERAVLDEQLQRAQRLETVGTLAAGIAHDFNNLLVPILGYAEMTMGDLPMESAGRQWLREVIKAGHRARDLITQLLAFSREQIGDRRVVQVGALVDEVLVRLRSSKGDGVVIDYRCDQVVPSVLAEPGQLRQVVLNVLVNALDAVGKAGTITIRLEGLNGDRSRCGVCHVSLTGAHVHLSVTDSGPGMTRDVLAKVFDPFFSTKPVGDGSGLGLAVCHGIVTHHGGHICAASRPGHGTSMHIYLPVAGAGTRGSDGMREPGKPRVLLVGESGADADASTWTLERIGCEVTVCRHVSEVLDQAQNSPGRFDFALINYRELERQGQDVLRALAELPCPVRVIVGAENPQRHFRGGRMLLPCSAIVRLPLLSQEIDRTIRDLRATELV